MKNLFTLRKISLTLALLSITVCSSFAQQTNRFHKLIGEAILQECDINGSEKGFDPIVVPSGSKFTIVGVKTVGEQEYYIIRFWAWDTTGINNINSKNAFQIDTVLSKKDITIRENYSKAAKYNYDFSRPVENLRFFRIQKSTLEFYATEIVSRWSPSIGSIALPFKYRYQSGEFKKDLSIASMGGIKMQINSKRTASFTFLVGVGISSVGLDSLNTKGKVLETQDRSAVSLSAGIVYQWDRLQIGIFTGNDWLTTPNKDNWSYQGKNWLSIGIGVSLFSEDKAAKKEGENDE